jgi:FkbM family methyltransferase
MTDWKFIFERWILGRHKPVFYEPAVKHRLQGFRGNLFVDIGANQGLYSVLLARNFRKVYAFEPNPTMIPILAERVAKSRRANVKVFEMALGDSVGNTTLYSDPHVGFGGSVDTILPVFDYKPNVIPEGGPPHVYMGKTGVEVTVSTYDVVVRESADLVKIDVEGAEFLVLEGMKNSLEAQKVKVLMVELHNRYRREELESLLPMYRHEWVDHDHLLAILS